MTDRLTAEFVRDLTDDGEFAGEAYLWKLSAPVVRNIRGTVAEHQYVATSSVEDGFDGPETVVFVVDENGIPYLGGATATGDTPRAGAHVEALQRSGFVVDEGYEDAPEIDAILNSFNPERTETMSLNLTPIDTPPNDEWLPGLDIQLFESDRELETREGRSRFVVVVTGHGMTWAGLATEDTMPINGFDGTPEVVLLEEDVNAAIRDFEQLVNYGSV